MNEWIQTAIKRDELLKKEGDLAQQLAAIREQRETADRFWRTIPKDIYRKKCYLCGADIDHFHHVRSSWYGCYDRYNILIGLCLHCHHGMHTSARVVDCTDLQDEFAKHRVVCEELLEIKCLQRHLVALEKLRRDHSEPSLIITDDKGVKLK